ncbi:MAG TPA: hypothetical protein VLJ68_12790 [Chitinophagaceae bacterium]|nr:hypothetical protein [Chitinophagaceae bacterium]
MMLFLAVFCGFLAEYKLEHTIEHQRAKEYATNLYAELKKDTVRINELIKRQTLISEKLDSFCTLVKKTDRKIVTPGMLYSYARYATNVNYFSSQNATIEQLKNSGSLRIMSSASAQKISEYDKKIRELEKEYGLSKAEFQKIEDLHFRLFDVYTMETLPSDTLPNARDSILALQSLYVLNDPAILNEYTGWIKFEADIYIYQTKAYLTPIKQCAEELIGILKKEYHLD